METVIGLLLKEAMSKRGLSLRAAGAEMGIAHTTLRRVLNGETVDLSTMKAIGEWLGIEPSTAVNTESVGTDPLAAQIAAVLETEPRLAQVFGKAMERVLSGEMEPRVFRELASYAAYLLYVGEIDEPTEPGEAS